jgi:hypothetical protein
MGIKGLITSFGNIVSILIPISVGVALLVFFWGLVTYIYKSDNVAGKDEGKNKMIWGIVALFVMVSVWGLIQFMQVQFGILNTTVPGRTGDNPGGGGETGGGAGGGTNPPGGGTGGGGGVPVCGPFSESGLPCD